ncbi:hypothetical protein RND81_02G038700 [Saponaria officinalis]|uniref:Pectinesterase inhibitor domain-containing protein n=1 Tax=Saponaria officinalis TaxID=3572 RepID=A0AAW1MMZ9_SAPOF
MCALTPNPQTCWNCIDNISREDVVVLTDIEVVEALLICAEQAASLLLSVTKDAARHANDGKATVALDACVENFEELKHNSNEIQVKVDSRSFEDAKGLFNETIYKKLEICKHYFQAFEVNGPPNVVLEMNHVKDNYTFAYSLLVNLKP